MHLRVKSGQDLTRFADALACPYMSVFRATDLLDDLIRGRGVRPVSEYWAMEPDRARALLAEMGLDRPGVTIRPVVWNPVGDGHATFAAVRAGLGGLDVHPDFMAALVVELDLLEQFFGALAGDQTTGFYLDHGE
jgi:hypothetical protein